MKHLKQKNFKHKAFLVIIGIIFLIILFTIIVLIPKEASSEISVSTEKNHFSVDGCRDKDISYKFILNNSEDEDIIGTIEVESAKPYDTETPKSGSTIIAKFGNSNKMDFEISANSEIEIYLSVSITKYAHAGTYYFPLTLIINGTEEELERDLAILTVEPFYDFEIELDKKSVKKILSGDILEINITIKNKGNVEEDIMFILIDYPNDWKENIYFNENPLKVPIFDPDRKESCKRTIKLIIKIPDDLEINEYEIFDAEVEFCAKSIGGEKKVEKIRLKVIAPEETLSLLENEDKPPPQKHMEYIWMFLIIFVPIDVYIIVTSLKKE